MPRKGWFAKGRLGPGSLQHPLGRFDVHPLDHLVFKPFGAAVEYVHEFTRSLHFGLARGEFLMARRNLVRVDQALAVETEAAALLRFRAKSLGIIEPVEHSVEHRHA